MANYLIDCTNLKVGGGIQVATSFINDLNKLDLKDQFVIVLSSQMRNSFERETFSPSLQFIDLDPTLKNKHQVSRFLKELEIKANIHKVFCVFGPSYYKSDIPKIVGYAIPHYIYKDSPFFDKLTYLQRLRSIIYRKIKVATFLSNSDVLIFETDDARRLFVEIYKFKKTTYVVNNTLNEIFFRKDYWREFRLSYSPKIKILTLSANYPHKNLSIIPDIVDRLLQKGRSDIRFYLSIDEGDLQISLRHKPFIVFLGKVSLDQIPSLYNQIDCVLIPTLLEVFSATYLEAMYMKRPIIASDMGFAKDICKDAALYYSPTDAFDAADKILQLVGDKYLQEQLINKGATNIQKFGDSMGRTKEYLSILGCEYEYRTIFKK